MLLKKKKRYSGFSEFILNRTSKPWNIESFHQGEKLKMHVFLYGIGKNRVIKLNKIDC